MNTQTNFKFLELFNSNVFSFIFQKSTSSDVILSKDPVPKKGTVPEKGTVTEEVFAKALPILISNFKFREFVGVFPKFIYLSKDVTTALNNQVWEYVQDRLNQWYPVPERLLSSNMGPRDQVSAQIKYLSADAKSVMSLYDFRNFPEDIQTIALQKKVITLEEIKYLEDFRKARDILVVWEHLSNQIRRDFSYNDLNTGLDWINKANTFGEWVFENSEQLDAIQELNLLDKGLSTLPPEIGNLRNLKGLFCSKNQLKDLPPEIGNLKGLRDLFISGNQLKGLPVEFGNLRELRELYLGGNQLNSLPPEIGELTNLIELDLARNQLKDLPPQIWNLGKLQMLDLGSNQLKDLPPEIGNLGNLWFLSLYDNQLKDLPVQICKLRNLQNLDLSGNPLKDLPPEIVNLKELTSLDVSNNPLKDFSPEIIEFLKNIMFLEMHLFIPNGLMFKYLTRDRSTCPSCTIL